MLLDLGSLINKYDLKISGVLHVGAHLAEEAPLYHSLGITNVWWVEGNDDNVDRILDIIELYGHRVISGLVADEDDKDVIFHITNYDSMSSSILEFGTHPTFSPDTVFIEHRTMKTFTLDSRLSDFVGLNFLNMDIQGAELLALKGATRLLPQIDYIYTEVNCKEVYKHCAQIEELDAFLTEFTRVETGWVRNQGWGDALYIRNLS